MKARCLQTKEILTDHSAQSIAEILRTFIAEWNINFKVFWATTDNGSNVVNAVVDLQLIHMPCIGHTLQLSIKKAFNLPAVQRVIGRCKKCIAHFNKSAKETYKLREKQKLLKLPEHELVQDCVTRWGGILHMLERIQEQQAAIAAVLMEGRNTHLIPNGEEWNTIEVLINVLKPFQKATEAMSGEKHSTISIVKPLLFKLLKVTLKVSDSDSPINVRIKEALSSDLSTRYNEGCIHQLLNVVTYLDSRYKNLPYLNEREKREVLQEVESMLMSHVALVEARDLEDSTELTSEADDESIPPKKKKRPGPLTKLLGDIFTSEKSYKNPIDHARNELVRYEAEETLDLDGNPLKWWKERDKFYPILSDLSCKLFSLPATSVPSERIFSCAGNVITEKRSRLLAQMLIDLFFV